MSLWTFQVGLNVTVDETWVDVTSRHRYNYTAKGGRIDNHIKEERYTRTNTTAGRTDKATEQLRIKNKNTTSVSSDGKT
jgi:hypothetical protein